MRKDTVEEKAKPAPELIEARELVRKIRKAPADCTMVNYEDEIAIAVEALARCANEARLEALEQAACEIDKCNQEGPYQAIAGAERIRALKAAQHGEKELRKAQ